MTRSLMQSEDEWSSFLDRTAEWFLLADVFDAINQNTRATGQWKKKPPAIEPYPRPGVRAETKTLSALHKAFGQVAQQRSPGGQYADRGQGSSQGLPGNVWVS